MMALIFVTKSAYSALVHIHHEPLSGKAQIKNKTELDSLNLSFQQSVVPMEDSQKGYLQIDADSLDNITTYPKKHVLNTQDLIESSIQMSRELGVFSLKDDVFIHNSQNDVYSF